MPTIITDLEEITIPTWVDSLEAFRRWTDQPDFPPTGRIWWLCGQVWVDMSKEQIFSHVLVKTELIFVLGGLVKASQLGLFLTDGPLLSNFAADISGNPDGIFLANATLQSDRVRLIEGKRCGYTEIQGSPDLVVEVLSDSSVHKDKEQLHQAYWEADIREYWVVDARTQPLEFDILRSAARLRREPQTPGVDQVRSVWQSFSIAPGHQPSRTSRIHPSPCVEETKGARRASKGLHSGLPYLSHGSSFSKSTTSPPLGVITARISAMGGSRRKVCTDPSQNKTAMPSLKRPPSGGMQSFRLKKVKSSGLVHTTGLLPSITRTVLEVPSVMSLNRIFLGPSNRLSGPVKTWEWVRPSPGLPFPGTS